MLTCSECGTEQHEGRFCGDCGGLLIAEGEVEGSSLEQMAQAEVVVSQEPPTPVTSTGTNDSMDKVMETSKAYGAFFTQYLKQPSLIFSKATDEFKNGLISIAVVAVLLSLAFYHMIKVDYYGMGSSFLSVAGNALFVIIIFIGIIVSILFVINKFFGENLTFKEITTIYGAHMSPVIILTGVTLLLVVARSLAFGSILLFITMSLITVIVPMYLISSLLTRQSKGTDPLYGFLIYIVSVGISFFIVFAIFVDSVVNQFFGFFM